MTSKLLALLALGGMTCLAQQKSVVFRTVSVEEAREQAGYMQPESTATMYIWADKYVYQPGEPLTLRMTLRANDDLYPYTMFAYRVMRRLLIETRTGTVKLWGGAHRTVNSGSYTVLRTVHQ